MVKIDVPRELSGYIEGLQYDLDSLQSLLIRAAEHGVEGSEAYKAWLDEYKDAGRRLAVAKNELQTLYVQPTVKDGELVDWRLNFDESALYITEANDEKK